MLKSLKIIIFCIVLLGVSTAMYFMFFNNNSSKTKLLSKIPKEYSTEPRVDTNLNRLNKILGDNKKALNLNSRKSNPIIETYANIDNDSKLYDSLVQAGLVKDVNNNTVVVVNEFGKNDRIKTDKLIGRTVVTIKKKKISQHDTLASSLADIKPISNKMEIEFWESPVNYKGYRLGKDKMIVFGIINQDIKLVMMDKDLYLITLNNLYLIKPCSDFCKLNPIRDKELCTTIMQYAN